MSMNLELLKIARQTVARKEAIQAKQGFVDPATASGAPPAGGDPAAMGMDPAAMGGDPAAMGMDPAAMGAPPPAAPPPAPAGGGGGDLQAMIQSAVQNAMGGAGGAGGAAGGIKPKIDVNVALMQLSKMVARIADALKISIPASEMIATPQDLTGMASQQQQSASTPPAGAIQPLQPLQPAFPAPGGGGDGGSEKSGTAFDGRGLLTMADKAAGLAEVLRRRAT